VSPVLSFTFSGGEGRVLGRCTLPRKKMKLIVRNESSKIGFPSFLVLKLQRPKVA
jgi:hypothetical protein